MYFVHPLWVINLETPNTFLSKTIRRRESERNKQEINISRKLTFVLILVFSGRLLVTTSESAAGANAALHPGENTGVVGQITPGFQVNDETGVGGKSGQRHASVSGKETRAQKGPEKGSGVEAGPVSPRTREFRSRMAVLEAEHKVSIIYPQGMYTGYVET